MINIVFIGTSDFGIPSLLKLINCDYCIKAIYTQPSKLAGRGMLPTISPIEKLGKKLNINIYTPNNLENNYALYEQISSLNPDFLIVIAYGKILPEEILSIPKIASINLHGSLLPMWRGATPIERSIISNTNIGITTMLMDRGMDSGDILLQASMKLDMTKSIHDFKLDLSLLGSDLLLKTLKNFHNIIPSKQDTSLVTFANKFASQDYVINWNESSDILERKIYALDKKMHCFHNGQLLKIISAESINNMQFNNFLIGEIVDVRPSLIVKCGNNTYLKINALQRPNKKLLLTNDFLNGYKINVRDRFF